MVSLNRLFQFVKCICTVTGHKPDSMEDDGNCVMVTNAVCQSACSTDGNTLASALTDQLTLLTGP